MSATTTTDFDRSKLALSYDVERLQQETLAALQAYPSYIYYSVIALTMPSGCNPDITDFSDPNWTQWADTEVLKQSEYIQSVLASLACRVTNVRLLRLEPGAIVKEHTDPQLNLDFRKQVRLHVPVFSDESVEFKLNGTPVPMQPGELWYMRLSDPHSVHNHSQWERIHLSIDVVVNEWIEEMIFQGKIM